MPSCQFCSREISKMGPLKRHEKYCKSNPSCEVYVPFNKGKKMKDVLSDSSYQNYISSITENGKKSSGRASTDDAESSRREKIRKWALESGNGGHYEGTGRGKKGRYKGFYCDSSWELAFLVYHLDHGIEIHRNYDSYEYVWEGKIRKYFPDFIVENKLVEIKGFRTEQWEAKIKANPDIVVLYGEDIKPYLDYVNEKYGKDFCEVLYEEGGAEAVNGT